MIELRPHQLEALDAMNDSDKGQIIVPTGGGKTMCMIEDVKRQFKSPVSKTIVVVAPRILLANQLCSEFLEQNLDGNYNVGVDVIHVHSGETHYFSTTSQIIINTVVSLSSIIISLCLLPIIHYTRYKNIVW